MNLKILAINFGGLGDQILFLSTMAEIKKKFPKDEIFFITETRSKNIFRLTKDIKEENIICFDYKGSNRFLRACQFIKILREGQYDYVFCTGTSKLIPVVLWLSGIKNRFYINNAQSFKDTYAARVLFECLRDFANKENINVEFSNPRIDIEIQESTLVNQVLVNENNSREQGYRSKDQEQSRKVILIHPGVSQLSEEKGMNKSWDAKGWAALISRLLYLNEDQVSNCKVILGGGPEDESICSEIIASLSEQGIYSHSSSIDLEEESSNLEGRFLQMGGLLDEIKGSIKQSNFINLAAAFDDLSEFALLVSKVDLMICLDSFPMHLSYSLGTKTIALFSTTDHRKLIPNDINSVKAIYSIDNDQEVNSWDIEELMSEAEDMLKQ